MERDRTGKATLVAAGLASNIIKQVLGVVHIGPGNVSMSKEELLREVKNMGAGQQLLQMTEILGREAVVNAKKDN